MQDNGNRQTEVVDARARDLVIKALEDERYEWRTVEGVAEQTGIPAAIVQAVLKNSETDIVRSTISDELGRALYTTRRHYRETHGLWDRFRSALSDKVA